MEKTGSRQNLWNTVEVKKIPGSVDNHADYNERSVQLYHTIHEYATAGYSKREIAKTEYSAL